MRTARKAIRAIEADHAKVLGTQRFEDTAQALDGLLWVLDRHSA